MADVRTCPLGANHLDNDVTLRLDGDLFCIVQTWGESGDDIATVSLTRENARRLKRVLDVELEG